MLWRSHLPGGNAARYVGRGTAHTEIKGQFQAQAGMSRRQRRGGSGWYSVPDCDQANKQVINAEQTRLLGSLCLCKRACEALKEKKNINNAA